MADIIEAAKVEGHWSSAWAPAVKRLYVGTSLGFVKEYDTETWELTKSWMLGHRFTEAFADEKGTVLFGVGQVVTAGGGGETPRYGNQPLMTGDLFLFEIPKD